MKCVPTSFGSKSYLFHIKIKGFGPSSKDQLVSSSFRARVPSTPRLQYFIINFSVHAIRLLQKLACGLYRSRKIYFVSIHNLVKSLVTLKV